LSLPTRRIEAAPVLAGIAPVPVRPPTGARHPAPLPAAGPAVAVVAPPARNSPPRAAAARGAASRAASRHVAAAQPASSHDRAKRHLVAGKPARGARPHLAARKPRAAPAHLAAAPSRPPHDRRHVAAARHVMRP